MPEEATFGLSAIEQIAVNAKDIERAVEFYRDKLGMKFLFSAPPGLAFFDCDQRLLHPLIRGFASQEVKLAFSLWRLFQRRRAI